MLSPFVLSCGERTAAATNRGVMHRDDRNLLISKAVADHLAGIA
jgi:hypothetical protein